MLLSCFQFYSLLHKIVNFEQVRMMIIKLIIFFFILICLFNGSPSGEKRY